MVRHTSNACQTVGQFKSLTDGVRINNIDLKIIFRIDF